MKRSFRSPVPSHLSDLARQRLGAYAMAASAAGVGLLALTQPVEGQIVYTPVHVVIKPGSNYLLDMTKNGKPELELVDTAARSFGNLSVEAWGSGGSNNKVEISGFFAAALKRGVRIGPSQSFYECGSGTCSGMAPHLAFAGANGASGPWANVQNRYLGVQFPINGELHYGWARLSVSVEGTLIKASLTGYAYQATAKKPIIAGQIADNDDAAGPRAESELMPRQPAVQQPASLGVLALGSQGLESWRMEGAGKDQ